MIRFPKVLFSLFCLFIVFNCSSSKDDCTKTIIVQYESTIYGQLGTTYIPEITQEVPCNFPEPEPVQPIGEGNVLNNFSYEVLSFVFTPDTGNNTSRLQFEIKLINENNFTVRGNPVLTIKSDNLQFSKNYSADAMSPCNQIEANSSCTLTFDKEYPIDPNLGVVTTFELVSVKYVL